MSSCKLERGGSQALSVVTAHRSKFCMFEVTDAHTTNNGCRRRPSQLFPSILRALLP